MKQTLFRIVVTLSLLAGLAGSSAALAQGPLPPQRPMPPQDGGYEDLDPLTGRHLPPRMTGAEQLADVGPEAGLGQPGLSFRYVRTFGVPEEAYPADVAHLNGPWGVFVDAADNLYVAEEHGHRLLVFDSSGSNTLALGHAGMAWPFDDYLGWIHDTVVRPSDGHIWAVMNPVLKEFDETGNLVRMFPAVNPWETGTDNGHFSWDVRGVAIDGSEMIYVSDTGNHRIQVFDVSGGSPVYVDTIGVTGLPQDDNTGFDTPGTIVFDSSGRLYVMDSGNFRLQRCTNSGSWTCSTFLGETDIPGTDLNHLGGWSFGVTVDASDNIFIADTANQRVLKCSTSASCTQFAGVTAVTGTDNAHFKYPMDVAVDSGGNVYVSDIDNFRVQKFNSMGVWQTTLGVLGTPYVPDLVRLNSPWGVAVGADGSIYVTENRGMRLVKMNAGGVQQWAVGKAGVWGSTNTRLGSWWAGPEGNPAVDASGRIYVPDTGNNRVQIFNPTGTFFARITGFSCPNGVAISPVNGDIYVSDVCDNVIKVFTSSRMYKATLGTTGVAGSDNKHFSGPRGVTVASNGAIFVADSDNHRVQKCLLGASTYTCSTFAGQTGVFGGDFGHLHPLAVAVDAAGRVYVADEWNQRVQVFDAAGAYLTTIGGEWGTAPSDFVGPGGVAVDTAGNVYVTDRDSHRIQKFAPGVPGWTQTSLNGFGNRWNTIITALLPFNGQLYAGSYDQGGSRAQLRRSTDGKTWSTAMSGGFGDASKVGIDDLAVFNGELYASTWNCGDYDCTYSNGGEIWRSLDGTTWAKVVDAGFGDAENGEIFNLVAFNSQLYASTWTTGEVHGTEVWRSDTGDSGDWERVVLDGFGDSQNRSAAAIGIYNGYLYAGTVNPANGAEVWRSSSGDAGSWNQVNIDGFGEWGNRVITSLDVFNGFLYASTRRQDESGAQVWRCQLCDGTDWVKVVDNGFGDPATSGISGLEVSAGQLFFFVRNLNGGMQVWRTADGVNWHQAGSAGLGDNNNVGPYWDNSIEVFNNRLYVGTINNANGGELWQKLPNPVKTVVSAAAQDGWTLEFAENSNTGGSADATATTFRLGDEAGDKQYRSILSFNTSILPDNAVITGVTLKIKSAGAPVGTNPFTTHGALTVDVKKGALANNALLQPGDFQAAASKLAVTSMPKTPLSGWYSRALPATSFGYINRTGVTQFRLRFALDDNEDMSADYMPFHSGNSLTAAYKPVLVITYYVP